jgi:hypothetical protein
MTYILLLLLVMMMMVTMMMMMMMATSTMMIISIAECMDVPGRNGFVLRQCRQIRGA